LSLFDDLDPDLNSSKSLDPDPHKMNANPEHCRSLTDLGILPDADPANAGFAADLGKNI
jgi:hypothetical protein